MEPSTPTTRAPATGARIDPSSPLTDFDSDIFHPSNPPRPSRPDLQPTGEYEWEDMDLESEDDIDNANLADDNSATAVGIMSKLKEVFKTLRGLRWTLSEFLEAFIQERDSKEQTIVWKHSRYMKTPKARRELLCEILDRPAMRALQGDTIHIPTVRTELEQLRKTEFFGDCLPERIDFDNLDFSMAYNMVQDKAPTLYTALLDIMQNQRAHRDSYSTSGVDRGAVLMVIAMISFAQAKKTSNFIPSLLGIYLSRSGVKRRVISVLHGLGICRSYKTGNRLVADLKKRAEATIEQLSKDHQTMENYDNMDIMDTKRDEYLGHTRDDVHLTTAVIIKNPEIPETGLLQSMYHPECRLDIKQVKLALNDNRKGVSIALIVDAIRRVHSVGVDRIYNGSNRSPPSMPVFKKLPERRTVYHQLAAIYANEGSYEGTYKVHEGIYLKQYGMSVFTDTSDGEQDYFSKYLRLVAGDQLTCDRIRGIKSEQFQASNSYDRKEWMIPVAGWFHIHMNFFLTIVRTHWAPEDGQPNTQHSIVADSIAWGRAPGNQSCPKYHVLEPLLARGFTSRVLAILYTKLKQKGLLIGKDGVDNGSLPASKDWEKPEGFDIVLSRLSPEVFEGLVEDIWEDAFTNKAWSGKDQPDQEYTTMCRYLKEVRHALAIKHAMKHGDVGLLRMMIAPLIVCFAGAKQTNYVYEMLHMLWQLSDKVSSPELQSAIESSFLVNWLGRPTTWKAVDLGLEHLNGAAKLELKTFKNSTHDLDMVFNNVCLTNTFIRTLREKFEERFGELMPGTHTTASARDDIFLRARTLWLDGLGGPRSIPELRKVGLHPGSMYLSADIVRDGTSKLSEFIKKFNVKFPKQAILSDGLYTIPDSSGDIEIEVEVIAEQAIEEYAEIYHADRDNITDMSVDVDSLRGDIPSIDI